MTCHYPGCHEPAKWTPTVELPTLRTAGDNQAMVQTSKPTVLLGKEVCEGHKQTYNLADWFPAGDWTALQDLAHQNGYHITAPELMVVQFRPLGWEPRKHLEVRYD